MYQCHLFLQRRSYLEKSLCEEFSLELISAEKKRSLYENCVQSIILKTFVCFKQSAYHHLIVMKQCQTLET